MWRSSRKPRRAASVRPQFEILEHRLTPAAGDLDLTFDADGIVSEIGTDARLADLIIQNDGKILAAGGSLLVRYNRDGSLDESFGTNGRVTVAVGGDGYDALALQADGKILVVGGVVGAGITRLNPNGSVDVTFGVGGTVGILGSAVAIQPLDGKIIVTNAFTNTGGPSLVRLNPDGSLDTSFDGDGIATMNFGGRDLAIQSDGKIVVAGTAFIPGNPSEFAVARYNTDGSLDTTFGGDGTVTTDFPASPFGSSIDIAYAVAVHTDGRITVAGGIRQSGPNHDPTDNFWGLVRYQGDGTLDSSFDGDGKLELNFGDLEPSAGRATDLAIQPDGLILISGYFPFTVARLQPDGSLDANFGADGHVSPGVGRAQAVALQADGKIVVGGWDFRIARYHGLTDTDGDGIADSVDTKRTSLSDSFSDVNMGGSTTGTITDRGDQIITIVDALDPTEGIAITTGIEGGPAPAVLSVFGGTSTYILEADRHVVVTPGSVNLDVSVGPVGVVFRAHSGQEYIASIGTGNSVTFHPETGAITAPATNPDTIIVVTGGVEAPITPGATVLPPQLDPVLVEIDVSDADSTNLASQGLIAVSIFTTAAFDAALVDVSSVYFAGAQAVHSALEDVDGDGDLDMVLHFRTQDTNLRALYEQLIADDLDGDGVLDSNHQVAEVSLTGATVEDVLFAGLDQLDLFLSGRTLRELLEELAAAGAI